jgi:hypothetical protein
MLASTLHGATIMSEFVTQMKSVFKFNCTQKFEYVESKQPNVNSVVCVVCCQVEFSGTS